MWILGYSRKNPHPHNGRHAGKSHGRGVNSSGNSDVRGALNLFHVAYLYRTELDKH